MKQKGSWNSNSDQFENFKIIFKAAKNDIKTLNYLVKSYAQNLERKIYLKGYMD